MKNLKNYNFKKDAEFLWIAIVAGVIAVAQLITASPEAVHTKEFWATVAVGAFARAVLGSLLSKVATE